MELVDLYRIIVVDPNGTAEVFTRDGGPRQTEKEAIADVLAWNKATAPWNAVAFLERFDPIQQEWVIV